MPATTLERNAPSVGSAEDILERLERYAAARRVAPHASVHPLRIGPALVDAATVDLFPYDLVATILGCAATILASVVFGQPLALLFAGGLAGFAEWARRTRWFPSVGTNLLLGTAIGLVLVLTA